MERRIFIKKAGLGVAYGLFSSKVLGIRELDQSSDLVYHKISDIKFSNIKLNYPRQVGKNSQLDVHGWGPNSGIHVLYTDKGASGWGINRGSQQQHTQAFEKIKGKSVSEFINPKTGIITPELESFDFSLFDLTGKILNKPVYQLLGKKKAETQLCYSGMIYFDDLEPADNPAGLDKILEECQYDYDYGYRQFKLKIGRGNRWMDKEKGLKRDIEVTKLVNNSFPDCDILVDGNNGFTVHEFISYLEGIEGIRLFWIEEPFHETMEDYMILNTWLRDNNLNPLLADGEAKPEEDLLRKLGSQNLIDVFLQDISGLGFTKWINFMSEIKSMRLMASPHAWGSAIKTNYISHLAGAFGSTPTIEGVTCASDDVDLTAYKLLKGKLIPSEKPGFGMDILKEL